ncbi:MAG: MFS transporter [Polyangiaceae bacterium]|nr:MFS transporter [Polyangiaceae bacterium]
MTAGARVSMPAAGAPAPPAAPARVATFAALRERNYRLYFWGAVISNIGTWMQRIAQDWLVLELTRSPFAVGVTMALQFLPLMLFGLYGGVVADRYEKRRLLFVTQAVMGLLAAGLAVVTLAGAVAVWHVYAVAFLLGLVTVVDNPARQVFVNELVPARLVRNAVSLNSGSFQLARLVGPAVAGVMIAASGSGWAFAVNAVSFLAMIAALLRIDPRLMQAVPRAARQSGQIREGLRYVWARPELKWLIALVFFIGTFGFNFAIILSAYAKLTFASTASLYGWLNATLAVGSLAGALLAARRATVRLGFLFTVAALFSLSMLILGFVRAVPLFMLLLAPCGMLAIGFNAMANATVQLSTDAQVRGRVMSLYMLVLAGGTPLGATFIGGVTELWGAPAAMWVSGAICLLATVACAVGAAREAGIRVHFAPRNLGERWFVIERPEEHEGP